MNATTSRKPEAKPRRAGRAVRVGFTLLLAAAFVGAVADMVVFSNPTRDTAAAARSTAHLEARNWAFSPPSIQIRPGTTVNITISNDGFGGPHNFSIDEQHIDVDIPPGQTVAVRVRAGDVTGTIPFYCRFHVVYGMRGEIDVISPPR